jgi:hypothetical protein
MEPKYKIYCKFVHNKMQNANKIRNKIIEKKNKPLPFVRVHF